MTSVDYFGSNLSSVEYNALQIEHIAPKYSAMEPTLCGTKWFDYRFMHPTQATYLYADCYRSAMKRAMVRRTDVYKGNQWNVFPKVKNVPLFEEDGITPILYKRDCQGGMAGEQKRGDCYPLDVFLCKPAYITSIWRGRQMADHLGIPYPMYCAGAVIYHEKYLWKNVIQPQAMFSTTEKFDKNGNPVKTIVDFIVEHWNAIKGTKIMASSLEQYKMSNFENHKFQQQHIDYVLSQVATSNNKVAVLAELIYERDILKPDLLKDTPGCNDKDLCIKAHRFYLETNPTVGDYYECKA